jgi:hypothetical protein
MVLTRRMNGETLRKSKKKVFFTSKARFVSGSVGRVNNGSSIRVGDGFVSYSEHAGAAAVPKGGSGDHQLSIGSQLF